MQVGDGNVQINYACDQTWTDGLAPPPLVGVTGAVDSPYRGLGAFEERDAAFFFGREQAAAQVLERMSRLVPGPGPLVVSGASRARQVVAAAGRGPAAAARERAGGGTGRGVVAVPGIHSRPRAAG